MTTATLSTLVWLLVVQSVLRNTWCLPVTSASESTLEVVGRAFGGVGDVEGSERLAVPPTSTTFIHDPPKSEEITKKSGKGQNSSLKVTIFPIRVSRVRRTPKGPCGWGPQLPLPYPCRRS